MVKVKVQYGEGEGPIWPMVGLPYSIHNFIRVEILFSSRIVHVNSKQLMLFKGLQYYHFY